MALENVTLPEENANAPTGAGGCHVYNVIAKEVILVMDMVLVTKVRACANAPIRSMVKTNTSLMKQGSGMSGACTRNVPWIVVATVLACRVDHQRELVLATKIGLVQNAMNRVATEAVPGEVNVSRTGPATIRLGVANAKRVGKDAGVKSGHARMTAAAEDFVTNRVAACAIIRIPVMPVTRAILMFTPVGLRSTLTLRINRRIIVRLGWMLRGTGTMLSARTQ